MVDWHVYAFGKDSIKPYEPSKELKEKSERDLLAWKKQYSFGRTITNIFRTGFLGLEPLVEEGTFFHYSI